MPEEHYDIQKFLKLRKLTRAIADLLRGQLSDYIATLTPMLRPRSIFGEYIQGGARKAFVGRTKPFCSCSACIRLSSTRSPTIS